MQKATLTGISNLPVVTGVKIEDPQGRLVLALAISSTAKASTPVAHRWLGVPITRLSSFVRGQDLNRPSA